MGTTLVEKGVTSQPAAQPEPLWRRADWARVFRITTDTVAIWQRDGRLPEPSCTIAGRSYWRADDVRAWLEKQEQI